MLNIAQPPAHRADYSYTLTPTLVFAPDVDGQGIWLRGKAAVYEKAQVEFRVCVLVLVRAPKGDLGTDLDHFAGLFVYHAVLHLRVTAFLTA